MATSCPTPTMATKFVQESAWALRLRCASVGGSEQAASSTSCLREPTLCIQSCLLLDSEASAELGRLRSVMMLNHLEVHRQSQMIARHTGTVWSTANASHQAVTGQTHWHYTTTHPHSVHTVTLITTFVKKSLFCRVRIRTPSICSFPFQQGVEVLIVRTCTGFQSRLCSLKYLWSHVKNYLEQLSRAPGVILLSFMNAYGVWYKQESLSC